MSGEQAISIFSFGLIFGLLIVFIVVGVTIGYRKIKINKKSNSKIHFEDLD